MQDGKQNILTDFYSEITAGLNKTAHGGKNSYRIFLKGNTRLMEKKIKSSDKPMVAKLVYAAVIAILCITAIVVGIVSAASKSKGGTDITDPPSQNQPEDNNPPVENPPVENPPEDEKKELTFVSPLVGTVTKEHSMEMPVFWPTLGEWKVHTGIDISAEEGASVYASGAGTVTGIYSDPMFGYTVEITHEGDIVTRYSNLKKDDAATLKVGDEVKSGDVIGTVGDTTLAEMSDEPHLHFEILVGGVKVNPLDRISEESKKASLGIEG